MAREAATQRPPYPTAPEVERLIKTPMNEGDEISHEQIASIIGAKPGTSRYKTVVSRWKTRAFTELNVRIGAVRGSGYRWLMPSERITEAVAMQTSGLRRIANGAIVASQTPPERLTTAERNVREAAIRVRSTIAAAEETRRLLQ